MRKGIHILSISVLICLLMGCQERVVVSSTRQTITVSDLSKTQTYTLRNTIGRAVNVQVSVNGTSSQAVKLAIRQRSPQGNPTTAVATIDLPAGTYVNKGSTHDYYSSDDLDMVISPSAGAKGKLDIEWSVQ